MGQGCEGCGSQAELISSFPPKRRASVHGQPSCRTSPMPDLALLRPSGYTLAQPRPIEVLLVPTSAALPGDARLRRHESCQAVAGSTVDGASHLHTGARREQSLQSS
jgi:hypothetical protein